MGAEMILLGSEVGMWDILLVETNLGSWEGERSPRTVFSTGSPREVSELGDFREGSQGSQGRGLVFRQGLVQWHRMRSWEGSEVLDQGPRMSFC